MCSDTQNIFSPLNMYFKNFHRQILRYLQVIRHLEYFHPSQYFQIFQSQILRHLQVLRLLEYSLNTFKKIIVKYSGIYKCSDTQNIFSPLNIYVNIFHSQILKTFSSALEHFHPSQYLKKISQSNKSSGTQNIFTQLNTVKFFIVKYLGIYKCSDTQNFFTPFII